jgi:hypothetical protein
MSEWRRKEISKGIKKLEIELNDKNEAEFQISLVFGSCGTYLNLSLGKLKKFEESAIIGSTVGVKKHEKQQSTLVNNLKIDLHKFITLKFLNSHWNNEKRAYNQH